MCVSFEINHFLICLLLTTRINAYKFSTKTLAELQKPNVLCRSYSSKLWEEQPVSPDTYPKHTKHGPALLLNDETRRVWHKFSADVSFRTAGGRVCVGLELSTPMAYASAEHAALTELLVRYLRSSHMVLKASVFNPSQEPEDTWQLELDATVQGITAKLFSSAKKSIEVITLLGHQMAVLPEYISSSVFEKLRTEFLCDLTQCGSITCCLNQLTELTLSTPFYQTEEVIAFLNSRMCEPGRLIAFSRGFMGNVFVEALVVGGITEHRALQLASAFWSATRARPLSAPARHLVFRRQVIDLPVGMMQSYAFPKLAADCEQGTGVELYLQVGAQDGTPLQDLLMDFLEEIIRTQPPPLKGRNFRAFPRRLHGVQGFSFTLEDTELSVLDLDKELEDWIFSFRATCLENIEDCALLRWKEGFRQKESEPRLVFESRFHRYWKEICTKAYHFERPYKEAVGLKIVDKGVLLRFWDEYISAGAVSRRKLLAVVQDVQVAEGVTLQGSDPVCLFLIDSSGKVLNTKGLMQDFWSKIRKIPQPTPQNDLAEELMAKDPLDFQMESINE